MSAPAQPPRPEILEPKREVLIEHDDPNVALEQQKARYAKMNEHIRQLYAQSKQENKPKRRAPEVGPPEIRLDQVSFDKNLDIIGKGSYGVVYRARCRGQQVAVKVPHEQQLSPDKLDSFKQEVNNMSKNVAHPHIISLMGACTEQGNLLIVTEMCKTDVCSFLYNNNAKSSYKTRIRMARDVCKGMVWLHEVSGIIHGDLKPENILIDFNSQVKITDFGFSQVKKKEPIENLTPHGSLIWMAPEKMLGEAYTEKVDVFREYSFGIILWELITKKRPYTEFTSVESFCKAVCYDHIRPPLKPEIPYDLQNLMTECWQYDPKQRPTFREVLFRLNTIFVDTTVPNPEAAGFWKTHFLSHEYGLIEFVEWETFLRVLTDSFVTYLDDFFAPIKPFIVEVVKSGGVKQEYVRMKRFNKFSLWFPNFFSPEQGVSVINMLTLLVDEPWFHGNITSEQATICLSGAPEGSFLIRVSFTNPLIAPFAISLPNNNHYYIMREKGGFSFDNVVYSNLYQLVDRNKNRFQFSPKKDYRPKYPGFKI